MHDSRKKNYLCSWKEPKGDTSICLPYGRLSLLFITSGVLNSTFCSLHLSFCPLAGSWQLWVSRTLWSPLEQPLLRVSKSYWAPGSGSQGESVSCRVQITCLVGQRGCKAYPTVQGWSRLSSFPKAATSPCPGVESHVVIRKGNGKATKEHAKGQGTDSCQN